MARNVQPGDKGKTAWDIHTVNGTIAAGTEVTAQSTPEEARTGTYVKTNLGGAELDVRQVDWEG